MMRVQTKKLHYMLCHHHVLTQVSQRRKYNQIVVMDDQCVYARGVLGRMMSTATSTANSDMTYSQSQTPGSSIGPGMLIMAAAVVVLLLLSLRNRRKTPESKLE